MVPEVEPRGERLPPPPPPRWDVSQAPAAEVVHSLEAGLGLPRVLCGVLAARGVDDPASAKAFLRPLLSTLHSPEDLTDLPIAVARIKEAIEREEVIFIHGDYDVDGMAGSALLTRWIRRLGGDAEPFVPHRLQDGYDLGPRGVEAAVRRGASLLVTVDCGILAHDAVSAARDSGLDVIVTDHHAPGDTLPEAQAVLNPNRIDCAYPNKGLCGAGVAFKLCQGLASAFSLPEEDLHPFLDLVAMATVADLVPLTGENRTLVRYGLKALARTENLGLGRLMEEVGLEAEKVSAGTVGFVLAPRLNAVGRLGDPSLGLRLLITTDPEEARSLAREADALNRERQEMDRATLEQAMANLAGEYDPAEDFGVVLAAEGWHPGVVGIVASRVVERLHRPTILFAMHGEKGRGSARSIPGFHLLDAVRAAGGHLERFGGHRQAAGMEIRRENLGTFRDAFLEAAKNALMGEDLRPRLGVDLEVRLEDLTQELHDLLTYLGPHGMGNPRPVFLARNVEMVGPARVVGSNHLKLRIAQGSAVLEAIGFNLSDRIDPGTLGRGPIDVVFQLQENEFRGITTLQARLKDLRRSGGEGS